jgi:hypothetical protein
MYYTCRGLPYGKEHQTLLIDDEPNKVLWNPKWSGLFLNSFKEQMFSNNKVQWLDLTSRLWPPLVELPLAKIIRVHYDYMVKCYNFCLNFSSKKYYFLSSMWIMKMVLFVITNPLQLCSLNHFNMQIIILL